MRRGTLCKHGVQGVHQLIAVLAAALLLASCYPLMKRYTHLPEVVLGMACSWSIPMAFAAQREELPPALWLLFTASVLWTVVYDTKYAMVDRKDDLEIGIKADGTTNHCCCLH